MNYNQLTPDEERVILHKGTERPWTGSLLDNKANAAIRRYTLPNQNLNRIAVGQVLMTKFRVL
jgi:peptide methionine sulfoxide reductase MsrB